MRFVLIAITSAVLLTSAAASAVAVVPVFGGCTSKVHVRPHTVVFACGDGNFFATRLRWTRWDASQAFATGIGHQNDCTPDCAGGRFHAYPVSVHLTTPLVCAG